MMVSIDSVGDCSNNDDASFENGNAVLIRL